MPEQFLLPGIESPPRPLPRPRSKVRRKEALPHSLFFAIFPHAEGAASVAALGARLNSRHELKGTLIEPHRLHVTLHDLGGFAAVPRDKVDLALAAAATVAAPSFDVVFDQAMTHAKNGAFVLCGHDDGDGVLELAQFRQRLGEALADAGFKPKRAFAPHMTLAYTRRKIERHAIEPVRWTAGSFSLIDSHVGEGVHEVLGRWPA